MNKQSNGTLVKDDNSLFELINQLTEELPPRDKGGVEDDSPVSVKIELPFSVLLNVVDRLPFAQATLLHHRLEERLENSTTAAV
ncbi:MAG: hypothetical protein ACPGWR_08400 [Ardenticatenaceae bacterium]